MIKDWNGCRKGECEMWGRVEMRDCPLASNGKAWCVATGEFFIRRPQEPVVEYEGVKFFTVLDLAQAGIAHRKIREFQESYRSGLSLDASFSWDHARTRELIEKAGITMDLEKHGFIKRKAPEIKEHDWVTNFNGWKGKVYRVREADGIADVSCPDLEGLRGWPLSDITIIPDPIFPVAT